MRKQLFRILTLVIVLLLADQVLKIWIKTNFMLGEELNVAGQWFILHFTENNGMAFGIELAGAYGKLLLTLFRILVVGGICWYLITLVRDKAHAGLIASVMLVVAGALGNIIDSVFYGIWFDYAGLFHGRVVDMFYFPLINGHFPEWFPVWGGEEFIFFRPVFNLADAYISTGVISIFVFQKRFFQPTDENDTEQLNTNTAENEQ
jgi:signal peptidase II